MSLIYRQRYQYLLALLTMVVASVLDIVGTPVIVRYMIDHVLGDAAPVGPAWFVTWWRRLAESYAPSVILGLAAALILAVSLARGVLDYLAGRCTAFASELSAQRLRDRLYDHLQRLPVGYFARAETGDLVQRCTSDIDTVRLFVGGQIVELVRIALYSSIVVPLLFWMDWRMGIASTALLPVLAGVSLYFFYSIRQSFKVMDEAEGALTATIQENITGIRVVRAFARQDHERAKLAERNAAFREGERRLFVLFARFWSLTDLLIFTQLGVALFYGARLAMLGPDQGGISVGQLWQYWLYIGMVAWPMRQLGRILGEFGKATVASKRINEVLSESMESNPAAMPAGVPERLDGDLVFEGVSVAYDDAEPVLRDISFTARRGQTVALLGPSGSGKSTLMSLLLRFVEPSEGRILFGGHDIATLPRGFVRSHISSVLQEPFLYSRSVRENLLLAERSAGEEQMAHAMETAAIHSSVLDFEKGYDTLVGERGITLSGGQRQRLAIARALLRDAPILLLDDALSAVDTRTERRILEGLRRRHRDQITLLVAHRLTTVMQADQILVLESGGIRQRGTHAELVAQPGPYQRLWAIQSGADGEEDHHG
ncbi:ABC transporter ATP-binding protein [Mucisphaera calidilacus]|uniref:Putative multidrug resistance ABC transporter ATP-binding/permease protein YheI n=1 Tax=Mucisphaera calidilacus TaxID=2527982 RepID=A0A518BZY1_9BACT|nr:ABC transporter ATP-binding protein [Mucisphaera calidilacus]QDU72530.1 putative multidrug resistance ABC transporter ATP-binding/permease protein YheI [Mucisphaera calidilacus]